MTRVCWCVAVVAQGFANDWSQLSQISQKTLVLAFFFFYVIFAIVLLNLFIGIVTDVYVACALQPSGAARLACVATVA